MAKNKNKKKEIEKHNFTLDRIESVDVPIADVKPNDYNPNRQSDHLRDYL